MSHIVKRYHPASIILHWVMAAAFFAMIGTGLVMEYITLNPADKFALYQWHKSLGVVLLLAVLWRMIIRWVTPQPPLPSTLPHKEVKLAKLGHMALYGFMLAMPLTGWLMVSTSVYGLPTIVFGLFEWPHIPNVSGDEILHSLSKNAHTYIAYGFIVVILGHIAAVVKHRLHDGLNLLPRMGIGSAKED